MPDKILKRWYTFAVRIFAGSMKQAMTHGKWGQNTVTASGDGEGRE